MNRIDRKGFLAAMLSTSALISFKSAHAQNAAASKSDSEEQSLDQEVALMRKDVRSQKKQLIAANMKLSDQEAEKFWPVYDSYSADLAKINDTKYELIKQYAKNYNSMTDDGLDKLVKSWLTSDESVAQLRKKYIPIFRSAVSAKSTARFFQLDHRITGLVDLQVASGIPLVQS
jgi:hypothetical protein